LTTAHFEETHVSYLDLKNRGIISEKMQKPNDSNQ